MRGADPSTFRLLGRSGYYAQDKDSVFGYWGATIHGADPQTFDVLRDDFPIECAQDKNNFYEGITIVSEGEFLKGCVGE